MKNLIATLAISMAAFTAPASASPVDDCYTLGEFYKALAEGRDIGISVRDFYDVLTKEGLPEEFALTVLGVVYGAGSDLSPTQLEDRFVSSCILGLV
jgi:hypothetical protein